MIEDLPGQMTMPGVENITKGDVKKMKGNRLMLVRPNKVAHFRRLLGWSQVDLAAAIGTSQGNLTRYERGKRSIPLETKEKIQEILGIPFSALFPRDKEG